MTLREFLEEVRKNKPEAEDYALDLSHFFVFDEETETTGIADFPILGWAYDGETKELRFVVHSHDVDRVAKNLGITIRKIDF